jgi:hypothetical protein
LEDTQVLGEYKDKQVWISNHEPGKRERLKACLEELATLLYEEEADKSQITDLEGIAGLKQKLGVKRSTMQFPCSFHVKRS